jgi:hypothetical protein
MPSMRNALMLGREISYALSDRILELLKDVGDREVAEKTGIDRGVWYRTARRKRVMLMEDFIAVCTVFDLNFTRLYEEVSYEVKTRGDRSVGAAQRDPAGEETRSKVNA